MTQVGDRSLRVVGYRHLAPGFNPKSGEGARRLGGRFNPCQSFPVLYLCTTPACTAAELTRLARRQGIAVEQFLPREVWRIQVDLTRVLDLTDDTVLDTLELEIGSLVSDDYSLTNEIGEAAYEQGFQAIVTRSATAVDDVIAIFTEKLGKSILQTDLVERWRSPTDLASWGPTG
ncbi:MAG: RES family NAD+ phosphorylase [Acidimicrobiia bacterium]|nr:RES family NAD+ phosphorylase [Acidimicrobiia bacterium]